MQLQKLTEKVMERSLFYQILKASYKLVGDILVAYAGAEGDLEQNSYADFVESKSVCVSNNVNCTNR